MAKALTVCTTRGCPNLTAGGRCDTCKAKAEKKRGTASQRGYGSRHRSRFRRGVLRRDPVCVLCGKARSVHADHYPLDRRELEERGLDPDDPKYGRGLCGPCHSSETARLQPGGWNNRS
ncbi:hypothetical protein [Microbispora sp. CA-102843]|uniref:hypothetical protein n=1 Tax=Microbispora sp. CA-102843 TaxID=3239952 RepID=UPI003D8E7DDE